MFKRIQILLFLWIYVSKWNVLPIGIQFVLLLYKLLGVSYIRIDGDNFPLFFKYILINLPINCNNVKLFLKNWNTSIVRRLKRKYVKQLIVENNGSNLEDIYCGKLVYNGNCLVNLSKCVVDELVVNNVNVRELVGNILPYNLRKLVMINCGIEKVKIESDTLEEINLSDNRIEEVEIVGEMIERLYLRNNRIVLCDLKCDNLRIIDLSKNRLEYVEVGDKVEKMSLEENNFVVLPVDLLKVGKLFLDGNPIIPNLNEYEVMCYFEKNYLHFFENNVDMKVENVYEDNELVHRGKVSYSIKNCIRELLMIYDSGIIVDSEKFLKKMVMGEELRRIWDSKLEFVGGKLGDIIEAIFYLAEKNGCINDILPILDEEIRDGMKYCLFGKIGRIVSAIMGFGLIKNVICISQNEEIMMRYVIVKNRLLRDYEERSEEFVRKLREELEEDLVKLGVDRKKIEEWIEPLM